MAHSQKEYDESIEAVDKLLDEVNSRLAQGVQEILDRAKGDEQRYARTKEALERWQESLVFDHDSSDVHQTPSEAPAPTMREPARPFLKKRLVKSNRTLSRTNTAFQDRQASRGEAAPPRKVVEWPFLGELQAPLLQKASLQTWRDLGSIIAQANTKGASSTGIFRVPLADEIPGTKLDIALDQSILPGSSRLGKVRCSRAILQRSCHNVLGLSYDHTGKTDFDLKNIPERPDPSSAAQIIARFQKQFEEEGDSFRPADYSMNVDAKTPAQRKSHFLSQHSVFDHFRVNGLRKTKRAYPGIHTAEVFVTAEGFGAPFGAHREDFDLPSINYLVKGHPKVWIAVGPEHVDRFERAIKNDLGIKETHCSQFLRHAYSWISPEFLHRHEIHHSVSLQEQGQAIVVLPKTYHWGINAGPNLAEAINWSDDPVRLGSYTACNRKCSPSRTQFVDEEGLSMLDAPQEKPPARRQRENLAQSPSHPSLELSIRETRSFRPRSEAGAASELPQLGKVSNFKNMQAPEPRSNKRASATAFTSAQTSKKQRLIDLEPSPAPELATSGSGDTSSSYSYSQLVKYDERLQQLASMQNCAFHSLVNLYNSCTGRWPTIKGDSLANVITLVASIGSPSTISDLVEAGFRPHVSLAATNSVEACWYSLQSLEDQSIGLGIACRFMLLSLLSTARAKANTLKMDGSQRGMETAERRENKAVIDSLESLKIDRLERLQALVKIRMRIARRFEQLVQLYGRAILLMIPVIVENRERVMLHPNRLTDGQFDALIVILQERKGQFLRQLSAKLDHLCENFVEGGLRNCSLKLCCTDKEQLLRQPEASQTTLDLLQISNS